MIVIFFLILILILIFLYLKYENEKFISTSVDTIDSVTKYECYLIIDTILTEINKKYNKQLIRGEIDRVEKTLLNDNLNYKISIFINNPKKYTSKKMVFDISYYNDTIFINSINIGNGGELLDIERNSTTSRGSILFKPKINMDLVKENEIITNHSIVNYKETLNKQKDRTKWILDNESNIFDNKNKLDNSSKIKINWDCFGIATNDKSTKLLRKTPNFYINNFTQKNDLYNWLFDPSQHTESRAVAIV